MSEGVVSGVHWILEKERERESANAFARDVFPTPGTSSDHVPLADDPLFHITLEYLHLFVHRIDTFE